MPINKLRSKIDEIDKKILMLLSKRADSAQKIGKLKKNNNLSFHDPERETMILNKLKKLNKGTLENSAIDNIFREIFDACLSLQQKTKIIYLGPIATFTNLAALNFFGKYNNFIPAKTINEVFSEIEKDHATFGVVPIENSTEGIVNHTLDLFLEYDTKIYGEILSKIKHNLISKHTNFKEIKTIYSHNQPLAQCRNWLESNLSGTKIIEVDSTAKAAEMCARHKFSGAIASSYAAQTYNLNVLAKSIEDNINNMTRFLVISKSKPKKSKSNKTSVLFSMKDKVGGLYEILSPFKENKINLTKIESRPTKKKAWEYVFFLDFIGHSDDKKIKTVLNKLKSKCSYFKVLGSYPIAK